MNNTAHLLFLSQQQQRLDNWERNQNILNRQLFNYAEQHRLIKLNQSEVSVTDLNGAIAHFKYHPDIMTPLLSQAINRHDKSMLERALTEIRRKIF